MTDQVHEVVSPPRTEFLRDKDIQALLRAALAPLRKRREQVGSRFDDVPRSES